MQKGIAEINVSDSDELRLKKINENFKNLVTGVTPVGAISGRGGGYTMLASNVGTSLVGSSSFIGSLAVNDAFAGNLSAYMIQSQYITAQDLGVENLLADYATIDLANIQHLDVEDFYAKIGLIQDATIEDGWVTGTLAAVTIDAANIKAGTISADKIIFSDGSAWDSASDFVAQNKGLLVALNALALGGSDKLLEKLSTLGEEELKQQMQTYDSQLDGSIIMANTIVAEKVKVSDLQAFHATIGGFTITDNGLRGSVGTGLLEFRKDGYFRAGGPNAYIEVDPNQESGKISIRCTNTAIKEDLTIADNWKWDYSTSDKALNLMYIGV